MIPEGGKYTRLGGALGRLGGVLGASWSVLGASWGRLGEQHGSNLAPKTEPKSIKNRSQNQSIFESLLGLDFYGILVNFGRKMEPSWHPDGIKNRCQLRKIIFVENLVFPLGKTMILKVLEVEVGTKNHSKIH